EIVIGLGGNHMRCLLWLRPFRSLVVQQSLALDQMFCLRESTLSNILRRSASQMNEEWSKIRFGNWFNVVVFLCLSALVTMALLSKLLSFYSFQISDGDTGIYSNLLWNLVNGNWFYSAVLNRNHLGEHFSPIIVVLAPFYFAYPSPLWLLGAQGLAVGATYVLLYFIAIKIFCQAKINFAKPLALLFALWAFFYPPLTNALLFEFHPSTLATPLLGAAILALLHSCDRALWVLVAVLLLSKENAPLAVLSLGCYAWLMLSRPRLGITLAAVAGASAVLIMGVVMPLSRSEHLHHYSRLGPFALWRWKSLYLIQLLKALAYLPLASWRSLVCAAPLVSLNLSVAWLPQFSSELHYDDFASVFLLVAAMHGAAAVGSALKGRRVASYMFIALVAVLSTEQATHTAISSLFGYWFGDKERQVIRESSAYRALVALLSQENHSVIFHLQEDWPGDKERQLYRELTAYRSLPFEIGIAAQPELGPYLSERPRYVSMLQSEGVDTRRLKPGDKVLMTPIRHTVGLEHVLETNPSLTRVYVSPVLHVYE